MQNFGGLRAVGEKASIMIRLTSESKGLSEMQEAYQAVLQGLLTEKGIESPFDSQDATQIKAFFDEASRRWKNYIADNSIAV